MMDKKKSVPLRCGYVAIIGRPNVGKSTLLNHLLGKKISITSRKPQTTRHQILGIKTLDKAQMIFIDTPGIQFRKEKALYKHLNKTAQSVLPEANVILFVCEANIFNEADSIILDRIKSLPIPIILVINKMDKIKNKELLVPFIQACEKRASFKEIIVTSAARKTNFDLLEKGIITLLPETDEFYFEKDQLTNSSELFNVAELIREQLIRQLGDELPYVLAVQIESMKLRPSGKLIDIHALIWVERDGQKAIVIGHQGATLKKIGTAARKTLESYLDKKVCLKLWVKVRENWSDNLNALRQLGYRE